MLAGGLLGVIALKALVILCKPFNGIELRFSEQLSFGGWHKVCKLNGLFV
jgi:hypothetical protein